MNDTILREEPIHWVQSPSQTAEASSVGTWSVEAVVALFDQPFNDLLFRAQQVHREHFDPNEIQLSTLLSIKTGGCPEDCGYCPQSVHYDTGVAVGKLMAVEEVRDAAERAKAAGATRFAWARPGARPRTATCKPWPSWCARSRAWAWRPAPPWACSTKATPKPCATPGWTTTTTTWTAPPTFTATSSPRAITRTGSTPCNACAGRVSGSAVAGSWAWARRGRSVLR